MLKEAIYDQIFDNNEHWYLYSGTSAALLAPRSEWYH